MRGTIPGRFWLALMLAVGLTVPALAGDANLVSTMRNVNAVMEAQGYRINPAFDHSGHKGEGDLSPVQAFEILRPDGKAFSIGRLYTSCTCITLESPKRNFADGERAIMQLHNTKPTPTNGQIYAIYVQITSPIKTTLRFDTFVQSNTTELPGLAQAQAEQVQANREESGQDAAAPVAPPVDAAATEGTDSGASAKLELIVPETGDAAAEVKDKVAEAGEKLDEAAAALSGEKDSIAAEADARVESVTAAANEMAANMDSYFDELSGKDMPEALPPPPDAGAETSGSAALPPPPGGQILAAPLATPPAVAPAAPAPTPAPASSVGTRLEEAYQTAASGRLAPPAAAAPAGGKKPLRNIALITIGVKDLARSMRFYQALGWEMAPRGKYDQTAFFQLNGQVLVLYPIPDLLKEQNMEGVAPAPGGITLAIHVGSKEDVHSTYKSFIDAGGTPLKEPTEMLSGSVTSYVADPDGNPWEISWVPQFRVDKDGWLWLP